MVYIAAGIVGFLLLLSGNFYAIIAGTILLLIDAILFILLQLISENTGDVQGHLTQIYNKYNGTVRENGIAIAKDHVAIGDIVELERGGRPLSLSVQKVRRATTTGGGGTALALVINAPLLENKDLDIRVGRKTLLRLGDKFSGSDCVFYGAETITVKNRKILVAGKDRELFMKMVQADVALQDGVLFLLFESKYDEFRVGTGGQQIFKLGKNYTRGDTEPEKLVGILDAVAAVMNKIDTLEVAAETKPLPPEKDKKKGISAFFIISLVIVIGLFMWALSAISNLGN